jgi:hypothetical protein
MPNASVGNCAFFFAIKKFARLAGGRRGSRARYVSETHEDYAPGPRITKVTFTPLGSSRNIRSWFGSSGGGLPRRPEHSSGRF